MIVLVVVLIILILIILLRSAGLRSGAKQSASSNAPGRRPALQSRFGLCRRSFLRHGRIRFYHGRRGLCECGFRSGGFSDRRRIGACTLRHLDGGGSFTAAELSTFPGGGTFPRDHEKKDREGSERNVEKPKPRRTNPRSPRTADGGVARSAAPALSPGPRSARRQAQDREGLPLPRRGSLA